MNEIKVSVNFKNKTISMIGENLTSGDYNSTKMCFEFDKQEGIKIFEMNDPHGQLVFSKEIQNNEIILAREDNDEFSSIFNEKGKYVYEISLYDGDSKLTSASSYLLVDEEMVKITDEVVEPYLPVFDDLMSDISTAITETNNLNIEGEKVDNTATITITKKDGTEQELEIVDGIGLNYNWQGTSLGIKREDEQNYQYTNLKGEKGDAGAVHMIVVQTLPTEDIDESAIYLVPLEEPESQENRYAEYVYINNQWELLGKIGVQVDLTDYATIDYVNNIVGNIENILTTLDIGGGV